MGSIAVTGAAGTVGRRLVALLAEDPRVERVVAIDRRGAAGLVPTRTERGGTDDEAPTAEVVALRLDVLRDDPSPAFDGVGSVVHLVEDPANRSDRHSAATAIDRVLEAATTAGCHHAVVLSSALVYGARPDNPVPLSETHPIHPEPTLHYALVKAELEERARAWAVRTGSTVAVLRPTATLSERGSSWIGSALRAATAVRAEQVDPPVQFLHHDDLTSALALAAIERLGGVYNVAPDGWIGAETFRRLRGEAAIRLPPRLSEWRLRAAKSLADRRLLEGLEPYVRHPWVVANDRLRAAGWEPTWTNEEAFVAGTPPPIVGLVNPQRRQEIALGAVSAAAVAAAGAVALTLRRTVR